jgi:Family of unknown function (DUF6522)
MDQLPSSTVKIVDGEITIDAEAVAPKLGLSPASLKDEMRKGLVYSVAEAGVAEDAGRIRLTFRYRARVWRVVVEPDGTLVEAPVRSRRQHRRPPIAPVCLKS